jgi:hypothetical protein
LFLVSAFFSGLAMVIFVVTVSFRVFGRRLDLSQLGNLARATAVLLGLYLVLKLGDLLLAGELGLVFSSGVLGWLFLAELVVGVIGPMILFANQRVRQTNSGLVWGSAGVLVGVALNRTNVALLAYQAPMGATYVPHWMEILISVAAVAAGILLFVLAAHFLPILPEEQESASSVVPRWSRRATVFVSGALSLLTITVVLFLQPMTQAGAAKTPADTASTSAVSPREGHCQACHQDSEALRQAGADAEEVALLHIDPLPAEAVHAQIQCLACHYGQEGTDDMALAHASVVLDPTREGGELCLACHLDLPDEFPQDRLRTPHDALTHGETVDVSCSDCHGAVGHGFDPVSGDVICPMGVCLDCHVERQLDSSLTDCNACHIGPHDPVPAAACNDCHQSTDQWPIVAMASHPLELVGGHAGAACLDCHPDASFAQPVGTACADCHQPPGTDHFGPACQDCHTPAGFAGAQWPDHPLALEGAHQAAPCAGCHVEGQPVPEYRCSTCHPRPENHLPGECSLCHDPGGWAASISFLVDLAPSLSHEVAGRETCLVCHDPAGEIQPAPSNHGDYTDAQCTLCHK